MADYEQFRRRTRRRRAQRRLRLLVGFLFTAVVILLLAALVTALMNWLSPVEAPDPVAPEGPAGPGESILAPLPMQGGGSGGLTGWASIGPVQQQAGGYTLQALGAATIALPETGIVDASYFAGVAFLGDSVTQGFNTYETSVKGVSAICAYQSIGPSDVVNRAELKREDGGQEVALDALAASAPKAVYVLLGTNSLVRDEAEREQPFITYYGKMLEMVREAVGPGAKIYVQSIPPVRASALETRPGLAPERIARMNEQLAALALEQGCYYLDLHEFLAAEDGSLKEEYAAPDGVHLNGTGYKAWVDYLSRHVAYDPANPYLYGSPYYATG